MSTTWIQVGHSWYWSPSRTLDILFCSINALQCQQWRSTTTCAAALELPNLNYAHGELTLELKTCISMEPKQGSSVQFRKVTWLEYSFKGKVLLYNVWIIKVTWLEDGFKGKVLLYNVWIIIIITILVHWRATTLWIIKTGFLNTCL